MHKQLQVPDDFTELGARFVLWHSEPVNGSTAKRPYNCSGQKADITDPANWSTFADAVSAFERNRKRYNGVGFVFVAGDGLVGIDLDDCLDVTNTVKPWARGIVERFADTYMEVSPSGKGVKSGPAANFPALPGVSVGDGSIELYDHARYFTVTGNAFNGAPLQVENHEGDLNFLYERLVQRRQKVWPLQPLNGGRIPHGQQHSTLISIAGTLRARRVCDEAILACLLAINAHQCERPGPAENIARIVRSTRTWEAR